MNKLILVGALGASSLTSLALAAPVPPAGPHPGHSPTR